MINLICFSLNVARRSCRGALLVFTTLSIATLSGCKQENSEFYIPKETMRCVELTKSEIESRGESYSKYTNQNFDAEEALWVAGKKFDFDYVAQNPGGSIPYFRNGYERVSKEGKRYPGISVRMRTSLEGLSKIINFEQRTVNDPAVPFLVIELSCKLGVGPSQKVTAEVESVIRSMGIGDVLDYSISINESINFYEISLLDEKKGPFMYFLKRENGLVDLSHPRIRCDRDDSGIGGGTCFAEVAPWENINLSYSFPKAQLADFEAIHKEVMNLVGIAYKKGEN